jgi:hypothetical protein
LSTNAFPHDPDKIHAIQVLVGTFLLVHLRKLLKLSERCAWNLQVFESGLKILGTIKANATEKFRTHYRGILCPEYESENQEGYWQLIGDGVEDALRGQAFLWKSDDHHVCAFQSGPLLML